MNNDLMFSSKTPEWETPHDLFSELDKKFHFVLDVCANKYNTKCKDYLSIEQNSLDYDWKDWDGWKWMNPPYGREIGKWIRKASEGGVVALLPARTDTKWFHDYIYGKTEIKFIKGRLKFGCSKNSAPFPSMIVIFK